MPDGSLNPLPVIQIPYSKLMEKYNLTSAIHGTGHSAMVRLGLVTSLPKMTIEVLENAGTQDYSKTICFVDERDRARFLGILSLRNRTTI